MANTNWIFTINNPADVDLPRAWPGVRYCCWQLEGGENGTPHLQGQVVLEKRKRLGGMKNQIKLLTGNKGKELMNKQKTIVGKKKLERMDPGNLEKNLSLGEELTQKKLVLWYEAEELLEALV